MITWTKKRIEEIIVSNSSLVSGLSEASGVKFSWVEVSQKVWNKLKQRREHLSIEGIFLGVGLDVWWDLGGFGPSVVFCEES